MQQLLRLSVVILSFVWPASAPAAPLIVIESDVEALQPGDVIDGTATLNLPAESALLLVTPKGEAIKLIGPYKGQPDSSPSRDENLFEKLRGILRPEGETSFGMAVFRSVPGKTPSPWAANVTRSGDYCVRIDIPPTLRRAKSGPKTTLTLELISTGEKVTQDWPASAATLVWPTELLLKDGESYFTQMGHAISATELTLHLIPAALKTDAHRAAWMGEQGCSRQARQVLRALGENGR